MQNPVEFFRNLPKKRCLECGKRMDEQAESYQVECESCQAKKRD
ncbi:protein YhfH [Pullulanibacillus sp. KACC 23026]|nr:protein YhfH [Pullulanibacillus sp. KACC 23026]WEG12043.1 protein YhfH [Pullulanibacillus sp. KACC 23026]